MKLLIFYLYIVFSIVFLIYVSQKNYKKLQQIKSNLNDFEYYLLERVNGLYLGLFGIICFIGLFIMFVFLSFS